MLAIRATFGGVDRDVAVTGALLHDIGKLDAYTADPLAIDLTDLGKLQGEIPLGYYRVRRLIEDLPGFPAELAVAVLHIILSHHGQLEHGSPVVPCTREATLVHMIDNLGGRLGSFDRLEKELPDGSNWSGWDRVLGGGAWFGAARAASNAAGLEDADLGAVADHEAVGARLAVAAGDHHVAAEQRGLHAAVEAAHRGALEQDRVLDLRRLDLAARPIAVYGPT